MAKTQVRLACEPPGPRPPRAGETVKVPLSIGAGRMRRRPFPCLSRP